MLSQERAMSKSVVRSLLFAIAVIYMLPNTLLAAHVAPHASLADPAISCNSCHATHKALGAAMIQGGYNNVCLNCHSRGRVSITYGLLPPFAQGDMAINVGPSNGKIDPGKTQSSHKWEGSDDVPKAGAVPSTNPQLNGGGESASVTKNNFLNSLYCARCHAIHTRSDVPTSAVTPFLRADNTNDAMCLDCHRPRNQTSHTLGTHPVNVNYPTVAAAKPNEYYATPINSNPNNPTSDLATKKQANGTRVPITTVLCTTCHGVHFTDSNSATFDNASSAMFGRLSTSTGYLLKTDLKGANSSARNICTNCHITTDVNSNAKVKNHTSTAAGKEHDNQCADCHGGHVDEADKSVPNVFLVRRFMPVSSVKGKTPMVLFQYTSISRRNYNKDAYGVCVSCHRNALPSSISQHTSTDAKVCNSCHTHKTGFSADCTGCHGFPPRIDAAGPNGYADGYQNLAGHVSEATSPHMRHAGGSTNYSFSCYECHKGNDHNSTPNSFRDVFKDPAGTLAGSSAVYIVAPPVLTCSNVYCHSNGAPAGQPTVFKSIEWGPTKIANCAACHDATPATNVHTKHVSAPYSFGCAVCHARTVSDNSTILPAARATGGAHVNGSKDVQFSGTIGTNLLSTGTYNTTAYTCANLYCHSDGKGAPAAVTPKWTDASTGACGTCHTVSSANLPDAHQAHLTSGYGPLLISFAGTPNACYYCHDASKHINGTVEPFNASCTTQCHNNGAPAWVAGRIACTTCHTSNVSVISYGATSITAPDKSQASISGHGKSAGANKDCTACHNQNSAHINTNPAVHDKRLVAELSTAGLNDQCNYCHNDLARVNNNPKFWTMSTHFLVKNGSQAMQCSVCHDAHGTSNIWMVRSKIAFNSTTSWNVSFTNTSTGFIQPDNRGICQVCHTKTKFYRSGIPETQHPTRNCGQCHPHNAAGGAFLPAGSCDACHGYPPVPKSAVRGPVGPYKGTFGTFNNYTNAKYEDYSGGGGAHLNHVATYARATDGWSNCAICHSGGNKDNPSSHMVKLPINKNVPYVTIQIDQRVNFNNSLQIIYSGARLVNPPDNRTGSCINVGCHFQPTPRWSKDR